MLILGHRGASEACPENTLEAFTEAMRQGAQGVELDVQRCATGELIVCHDETLERLTEHAWAVVDTPWRDLAALDVGTTLGFPPARIPLLDQVFDAIPGAVVNVELKCDAQDDRGLSVAVGKLVTERRLEAQVFISSFNPLCLLRLAEAYPGLKRGLLIDPDRPWEPQASWWLPQIKGTSVHPHFSQVSAERVREWHAQGLQVATWTVNAVAVAQQMKDVGVDVVITNVPARLREGLR